MQGWVHPQGEYCPMVQKLGGAVLEIKWSTETDKFTIPLTVNISHRRRGAPTGPELSKETRGILDEAILTRRINLSLYDPLGFICPLTRRLKWHLQLLGKDGQKAGWDDTLSTEHREPWLKIHKLMVEQGSITINRSCKPEDVDLLHGW